MRTLPIQKRAITGLLCAVAMAFSLATALAGETKYTITKDEAMGPIKRTVEATLPEKVDEQTLGQLATEIKESSNKNFGFTFIGWRVEGEKSDTYWANTRFDPDMKITIIGEPVAN
ncbi:hypothetical protein [Paracandidimonas soli]|uniref:Uncharacterized protein n=1 Tax=Paracandidimonas soli TaxID=1917182 RepID=A0A4R3VAG8_9BURK|nr:hypothetical protein [Paracandidimonas soli]TCV00528.1 hypothetical protein EV686_103108 [Paracandidimonas soli]